MRCLPSDLLLQLCLTTLFGVLAIHSHAAVPSLYLVQNSGWMEPFFGDPTSPFRPLVGALVEATHTDGTVIIASFNQDGQLPGRRSPEIVYTDPYDENRVRQAIDRIDLPTRGGARLTDADFNGALVRGLNDVLDGHPGIVWMVTNNKNARNNSQEVVRNTREFVERLRDSDDLPYVVAYPVRLKAVGRQYSEKGLIIYGIAYGNPAEAELRSIVDGPRTAALFTDPAVKLKHLDRAPLVFTPSSVAPNSLTASSRPDGGLLIDGVPAGSGAVVEIHGALRSDYYPQVIDTATLALNWTISGVLTPSLLPGSISPTTLHRLAPRDALEGVTLTVTIPPVPRPPGLGGLRANGVTLNGTLVLTLTGVTMSLQASFKRKLQDITALDQLPEVFQDYTRLTGASTMIPVRIGVRFSSLPLIATLAATAVATLALVAIGLLLGRPREYRVAIGGRLRRVRLRAFETQNFSLPDGNTTVVTGSFVGRPRIMTSDSRPLT